MPRAVAQARGEVKRPELDRESGHGTVVLAEDESAVRALVCRWLERAGYLVLEAADGMEALELAGEHAGEIDLLLSDVVMPGMGGIELCRTLSELRPGFVCILMTGYSDRELMSTCADRVLQKPLQEAELLDAVKAVLSAKRDGVDGSPG